jgi:hypothetical protein
MIYAIGFLSGVIFVLGGLLILNTWANAVRTAEPARKVEYNKRIYDLVQGRATESDEDAVEAESEKKAA